MPLSPVNAKFVIPALIFCLFAAVFLVSGNTFDSPFVFDDLNYITRNDPHVHMTELSWEQLKEAALKGKPRYRPLANISFALNHYFGGTDMTGYHLVNVLIHGVTAVLLMLIARQMLAGPGFRMDGSSREGGVGGIGPTGVAFFAALLWLAHPVQTNAVTYIVQRMTSLAVMGYMLSLFLYIQGRLAMKKGRQCHAVLAFTGCILAGLCAVGTKENTATLPVFIILYEWFFFQDLRPVKARGPLIGLFIACVVFCAVGYYYLDGRPLERVFASYTRREFSLPQRVLTEWRVIAYYIGLVVYPLPSRLILDHDYPLSQGLFDPFTTGISGLMLVALSVLAVYSARKDRLLSFALFWFLGNLVIESSVIGIEIIYEHRLYLPSMMLFVLASHRVLKYASRAGWILLAVALVLGAGAWQRNQVWRSAVDFWADCAQKSPQKVRPLQNLAFSFHTAGEPEKALVYYEKSLIRPHPTVYYNMGLCLMELGRFAEAADAFSRALNAGYGQPVIYVALGDALASMGEYKAALACYRKAVHANFKDPAVLDKINRISSLLSSPGTGP